MATSEDPAEMLHNALHHYLFKLKNSSENEIQLELDIITCDPLHFFNIPSNVHCTISSGPRRDKTSRWGFRQSDIQISLLSYRDKLEH